MTDLGFAQPGAQFGLGEPNAKASLTCNQTADHVANNSTSAMNGRRALRKVRLVGVRAHRLPMGPWNDWPRPGQCGLGLQVRGREMTMLRTAAGWELEGPVPGQPSLTLGRFDLAHHGYTVRGVLPVGNRCCPQRRPHTRGRGRRVGAVPHPHPGGQTLERPLQRHGRSRVAQRQWGRRRGAGLDVRAPPHHAERHCLDRGVGPEGRRRRRRAYRQRSGRYEAEEPGSATARSHIPAMLSPSTSTPMRGSPCGATRGCSTARRQGW